MGFVRLIVRMKDVQPLLLEELLKVNPVIFQLLQIVRLTFIVGILSLLRTGRHHHVEILET